MVQIQEEKDRARVVVPYRAKPAQRDELDAVVEEERKGRASGKKVPSLSKVVEYVVGLGLDLYWARHELGAALDALQESEGWSRRRALTEALRRGLERKGKR